MFNPTILGPFITSSPHGSSFTLASVSLASVPLASVTETQSYDATYATFGFVVFVIMYFQSDASTVLYQTATFLTFKCTF